MTQSVPGEILIKAITVYNWPIQKHDFAGEKKMLFPLPKRHTWKYLRSDVWHQFFLMEEKKKKPLFYKGRILIHGNAKC